MSTPLLCLPDIRYTRSSRVPRSIHDLKDAERQAYVVYDDGSTYRGDVRQRERNGFGIQNFFNGDTYEGNFVDDKRNGLGKYCRFECGTIYRGNFLNNQMNGNGVITRYGKTFNVLNGKKIAV
jgi:hypothetical protein